MKDQTFEIETKYEHVFAKLIPTAAVDSFTVVMYGWNPEHSVTFVKFNFDGETK